MKTIKDNSTHDGKLSVNQQVGWESTLIVSGTWDAVALINDNTSIPWYIELAFAKELTPNHSLWSGWADAFWLYSYVDWLDLITFNPTSMTISNRDGSGVIYSEWDGWYTYINVWQDDIDTIICSSNVSSAFKVNSNALDATLENVSIGIDNASTSSSTGSLRVAWWVGIAKNLWIWSTGNNSDQYSQIGSSSNFIRLWWTSNSSWWSPNGFIHSERDLWGWWEKYASLCGIITWTWGGNKVAIQGFGKGSGNGNRAGVYWSIGWYSGSGIAISWLFSDYDNDLDGAFNGIGLWSTARYGTVAASVKNNTWNNMGSYAYAKWWDTNWGVFAFFGSAESSSSTWTVEWWRITATWTWSHWWTVRWLEISAVWSGVSSDVIWLRVNASWGILNFAAWLTWETVLDGDVNILWDAYVGSIIQWASVTRLGNATEKAWYLLNVAWWAYMTWNVVMELWQVVIWWSTPEIGYEFTVTGNTFFDWSVNIDSDLDLWYWDIEYDASTWIFYVNIIQENAGDLYMVGGNIGVWTTDCTSPVTIDGSIKIADDTDTADSTKVWTLRYRADSNNSYVDMCMQTGAATYAWVNIKTNTW